MQNSSGTGQRGSGAIPPLSLGHPLSLSNHLSPHTLLPLNLLHLFSHQPSLYLLLLAFIPISFPSEPSLSTPSSPAIWQHRDPTPAISSDDEDNGSSVQDSPEDNEEDEEEEDEEDEEEDQSHDSVADPDESLYSTAYANLASIPEPRTFKQSQRLPEFRQWKKACLEELEAHNRNGT